MALGEALGNVIGGLLGQNAAKSDRSNAKDAMKQAVAVYDQIGLPPDTSKALILQELKRQGIYTPQLEQDLNDQMAESQVGKIQEDPALRKAQAQALSAMQQRAKVGLSAEDRAALNQVRNEVQRDAEAKRQQVLQQMQARGLGGSGAALVAQLQAGQDAQNLASQQSDTLMSQAQQRALQALGQSNDMATGLRGQDFSIAQAKAQALDERNKFLQQNSIARQQANVAALNQAQAANLQEQQRIADYNAQIANQEKQRQAQAQADQYNQKLAFAAGKSGQLNTLGGYLNQVGAQKAQAQKDMGAGIGGVADAGVMAAFGSPGTTTTGAAGTTTTGANSGWGNMVSSIFSDEDLKTNIDKSGDEVDSFLNRISKKYR